MVEMACQYVIVLSKNTGTRDVIEHLTIRLATGHFRIDVPWNQVSIFSHFLDSWQTYCSHDLALLVSRDVICHVIIRLAIPHFL